MQGSSEITSYPMNANFSQSASQIDLKTSSIKIMTHNFVDYRVK